MTWKLNPTTDTAHPDYDRQKRKGVPEVIIAERKTVEQSLEIAESFLAATGRAILSRVPPELKPGCKLSLQIGPRSNGCPVRVRRSCAGMKHRILRLRIGHRAVASA